MLFLLATSVDAKKHSHPPAPHQAGQFDYYVLSLSWAPEYCKTHPKDEAECGVNRPGFVLHGLWPQYAQGGYPASCSTAGLDEASLTLGKSIFPSEKLVVHEWQKHGTCTGLEPQAYFQAADSARKSVTVPALLQPGSNRRTMALANVTQSLLDANPALGRRNLALLCAGKELSEVRVCLNKELQPMACGRDVTSTCKGSTITLLGVQ
ncbi:ribonuclease T2 [Pelomonas cellulosilytica]|uniref:Ribonuclease T2 n=1 Tax=Pelomonas cellulosilytica TaxID=2906762 RepID=A0ABS8XQG7_9BURK|nr:ribonuclease T2 [Pelomonas sp. P8]MCE4553897.1 ribonuclease T2 [Pelomonas sp. P8]